MLSSRIAKFLQTLVDDSTTSTCSDVRFFEALIRPIEFQLAVVQSDVLPEVQGCAASSFGGYMLSYHALEGSTASIGHESKVVSQLRTRPYPCGFKSRSEQKRFCMHCRKWI